MTFWSLRGSEGVGRCCFAVLKPASQLVQAIAAKIVRVIGVCEIRKSSFEIRRGR